MALTKDEKYLLENIFSKVEYENMEGKYRISMKDYLPLNLTREQQSLLEKMCKDNGIILEHPSLEASQSLSSNEVQDMFREYYQLKQVITTSTDKQELVTLQQKAIDISDQLVAYYSKIMYDYILHLIPEIYSLKDYEDIFQDGYEILIRMINTYDPNQSVDFKRYFQMYASSHILRLLLQERRTNPELYACLSKEKLQKKTGMKNSGIDYRFEKIQIGNSMLSLEELANEMNQNDESEESSTLISEKTSKPTPDLLTDLYECEQALDKRIVRSLLLGLLDTLPENQRETLVMRYGLNGEPPLSAAEIGEELHTAKQNIHRVYKDAIDNLFLPERYAVLMNLVLNYTSDIYPGMNWQKTVLDVKDFLSIKEYQNAVRKRWREQDYLKEILIKTLPKEELLDIVNKMQEWSRDLLIYVLKLNDGPSLTDKEIKAKFNISNTKYRTRKLQSLTRFIELFIEKYSSEFSHLKEKDVFEQLMGRHMTKSIRKYKHK